METLDGALSWARASARNSFEYQGESPSLDEAFWSGCENMVAALIEQGGKEFKDAAVNEFFREAEKLQQVAA